MTPFAHDLAVSAVPYDAAFVAELFAALVPRLVTKPVWEGHASGNGFEPGPAHTSALMGDQSRLALVVHQRLWPHHDATRADEPLLRERVRAHPESVRVVTLDDTPLPRWLAPVKQCALSAAGLDGAAQLALDAIESSGGAVARARAVDAPVEPLPRWSDGPAPFLAQPRAQSALRRELDALAAQLQESVDSERARRPERGTEIFALPHRSIVRVDDAGLSLSWVTGNGSTVADGRLLVIEWRGVEKQARGAAALKSATPIQERIYRAEGNSADDWRWRTDEPNGRAFSSANLAAAGVAGLLIERGD